MRLIDKAAAATPARDEGKVRGSAKIENLKAREERERLRAERVARNRESLCEVDQVVAANFKMPKDLASRTGVARDLLSTASGRKRTQREVAAIMGVTTAMLSNYLYPDTYERTKSKKRTGGVSVVEARKAAARTPQDVAIEPAEPKENFGARLTRRRRACGLSKSELARRMEVTPEQVTEWEQTKTRPSPGVYLKLMEVLD